MGSLEREIVDGPRAEVSSVGPDTAGENELLGAGLANKLLFTSAKVVPEVALTNGFEFEQPTLASALGALLNDD